MYNKISQTISWKYHRLRFLWPVWFYVLNRGPRKRWKTYVNNMQLTAVQARVVSDLKKDGIALSHIDELFGQSPLIKELYEAADYICKNSASQEKIASRERAPHSAKSDIIVHLFGGYGDTQPSVSLQSPFLRFTLSNELLHAASSYLDMFPLFRMCSFHSTILLPSSSRAVFSQRWHRDPDDKKLVKVFLYLSDVDTQGAGPFTYVKGSHLGGRWRHLYPQVPPVGSYPPEGALEQIIPRDDILMALGKKGTLIFCDTSGLHKGGYSTGKRRLMYAATFTSQAAPLQSNYRLTDPEKASGFPEIARYAIRL